MDTTKLDSDETAGRESEAERDFRMAWEADKIREAEADIVAGRLVDSAKVRLWIDSIGTDNERPVPYSAR